MVSLDVAINGTDGEKVAIKLITDSPMRLKILEQAKKEINFRANVVTILNSEKKGSSVVIVLEYCAHLGGNGKPF